MLNLKIATSSILGKRNTAQELSPLEKESKYVLSQNILSIKRAKQYSQDRKQESDSSTADNSEEPIVEQQNMEEQPQSNLTPQYKCNFLDQRPKMIQLKEIVVETQEESQETEAEDSEEDVKKGWDLLGDSLIDTDEQFGRNTAMPQIFSSFVSDLNMDGIDKVDVFADQSIYNTDLIGETACQKSKNIFAFLDSELDVKQVNIKQFLDSHQKVESSNVRDQFILQKQRSAQFSSSGISPSNIDTSSSPRRKLSFLEKRALMLNSAVQQRNSTGSNNRTSDVSQNEFMKRIQSLKEANPPTTLI